MAHFPPENNYGSQLNPKHFGYSDGLVNAQDKFHEKSFINHFLTIFGEGDGGGGPAEHLVERGRMARNLDGLPKVQMGKAGQLLDILHRHQHQLEEWDGELYLEDHRGVLTSQAWIKKANRQCEMLIREAEIWSAHLDLAQYPAAALERNWRVLLLNQFHDVLPGTSINTVYQEARQQYRQMAAELKELIQSAVEGVAGQCRKVSHSGKSLLIFNSLTHPRQDPYSFQV